MSKKIGKMVSVGILITSGLCANTSEAAGPNVWDGPYIGPQFGGATNTSCNSWTLSRPGGDVAAQTISGSCGTGSFVGGVQLGENYQYQRFFWGLAIDIDFETGKKTIQSWIATGPSPAAGTYLSSERLSPDGFIIVAPRFGYAGREWAPYLRAGGLLAFGDQNSSLSYKQASGGQAAASFNGETSFSEIGWVAGGGMEWGLYGPWSIGVEFMHAYLGKGSSALSSCAGTAATCARFSGVAFENTQSGFTSNIFRVSVSYYFDYW